MSAPPPMHHLLLDELNPLVGLAGCWQMVADTWHTYRVPGHHLILLLSGRIEALTPWGRFSAHPGELLCFRHADLNQYGTFGATHFYQLHVDFAPPPRHLLTPWIDEIGPLPEHLQLGPRLERARQLFEAICFAVRAGGSVQLLRQRAAVHELLALVAESTVARPSTTEHLDPWQRLRMRLEAQLEREIRIAQLARELKLSSDHLIRRFKQRFGVTPQRYRSHARLRWAAQRLRAGEASVKAIARSVGFSDPTAFTRAFRRYYGVLPSQLQEAGSTGMPTDTSTPGSDALIPINRHLVLPHSDPNWIQNFAARPPR